MLLEMPSLSNDLASDRSSSEEWIFMSNRAGDYQDYVVG